MPILKVAHQMALFIRTGNTWETPTGSVAVDIYRCQSASSDSVSQLPVVLLAALAVAVALSVEALIDLKIQLITNKLAYWRKVYT